MKQKQSEHNKRYCATYTTALSPLVSSTPNVSSDSVEGVGGVSPDRDWYVQSGSRDLD